MKARTKKQPILCAHCGREMNSCMEPRCPVGFSYFCECPWCHARGPRNDNYNENNRKSRLMSEYLARRAYLLTRMGSGVAALPLLKGKKFLGSLL